MRGKKPIPTSLKILRGNPGRRPLNAREPMPKAGSPEPLECLTAEALTHYRHLADQLMAVRVLTVADGAALSGLAQSIADYEEATTQLRLSAKVVQTERGMAKSPWYMIQKQAFDQMQRGLSDFGLTPSSRSKIQAVAESPDENPFANLA